MEKHQQQQEPPMADELPADERMMMEEEQEEDEEEDVMLEDDGTAHDQPLFLNPEDAVEVHVDDDDIPMDDEDDEDDDDADDNVQDFENEENEREATALQRRKDVVDMSNLTLSSHTGHVYAVESFYDGFNGRQLFLVSGGGDDRAFLHHIVPDSTTSTTTLTSTTATIEASSSSTLANDSQTTIALDYAHKDSVSCVALNLPFLPSPAAVDDNKKFPRVLAVGSYDGAIVLYNPDTGAQLSSQAGDLPSVLEGPTDVECLAWHPKGGSVLLAGSAADGTLWMYHVPMRNCLQVFVGHESAVTSCSFTPDGKWALSASSDGTVRLWAPRTGLCKHVFRFYTGELSGGGGGGGNSNSPPPPGLTCMAMNGGTDGQLIVVGAEDGQAHICHVGSKKIVASLRHYEVPPAKTATSTMQQDDDDDDEGEEANLPMSVEAVAFASPAVNPNWCATGGVDGVLKIWDLANNAPHCRQICQQPAMAPVEGVDASATASTTASKKNKSTDNKPGGITRLQWHPSLPVVFTADTVGIIRIWDARNGQLLQSLTGHTDVINDMNVSFIKSKAEAAAAPEDAVIISASDDKTVRLFHVDMTAQMQPQSTTVPAVVAAAVP